MLPAGMATKEPTRRRLRPEQRRALIVEAAAAEFGRSGHRDARMEDIARAAGVTKAVLYDHFPNKGALHAEVVSRASEDLVGTVVTAVGAADGDPGIALPRRAAHVVPRDRAAPGRADTPARRTRRRPAGRQGFHDGTARRPRGDGGALLERADVPPGAFATDSRRQSTLPRPSSARSMHWPSWASSRSCLPNASPS